MDQLRRRPNLNSPHQISILRTKYKRHPSNGGFLANAIPVRWDRVREITAKGGMASESGIAGAGLNGPQKRERLGQLAECLLEVCDQVFNVLDAHGQADQVFRHSQLSALN